MFVEKQSTKKDLRKKYSTKNYVQESTRPRIFDQEINYLLKKAYSRLDLKVFDSECSLKKL